MVWIDPLKEPNLGANSFLCRFWSTDQFSWDAIMMPIMCFAIDESAYKRIVDSSLIPCIWPKSQTWWLTLHPHRPVPKPFSNALRAIFSMPCIYKVYVEDPWDVDSYATKLKTLYRAMHGLKRTSPEQSLLQTIVFHWLV